MNSIGENKKVTRARVSLKEKWEAVKRMEKGDNSLAIAKELGVSQRVIYQWMSVKEKIKKWYKTNPEHAIGLNRKNLTQVHSQQLDQVVYLWYVKCVKQGISVTGPMIRHKAMELNEQLKAGWPFQASDGWLHKWKKRHGIIINPEQRFADDEPHQLFDDKFKTFIEQENLVADQVFICCEAFLYHKLLPPKTLNLETYSNNDRLSIVICCNATGMLKLPLLVIGKKDVKFDEKDYSTPKMDFITYKCQKYAWFDNEIFRDWFLDEFVPRVGNFLEEKLLPQKAILIVDDHSVLLDENIFQVGDMRTMYLPPKVTRLICMDEGVLENIKRRYRYKFLTSLYFAIENGTNVSNYVNNITINEILQWLATSWNEITSITINSLWKHIWTEMNDNNSLTICSESDPPSNLEFLSILQRIPEFKYLDINHLHDWFNSDRIMPDITDEVLIIEVQNMFSDTRDENRRKATVVPYNEEVPSKKCKSKEDQNLCRENEFVDVNNLSFDNQSESANNEISSLPVDLNSMSPTSSMNDSTIEQSNEEKNEILTLSKEHENKIVNESVEYKEHKSDKANEVDTFCERLAVSLRQLPPKTRSRVEINILKVLYEAEFGEKF